MKKSLILAAAFAAGLALPTLSPAVAASQERQARFEHPKLSAEDWAALTDARIAALKTGLKLTPAQEKNWPALEAALREGAKARAARFAEWIEKHKHGEEGRRNTIEALQNHAKRLQERATRMTALAEAAKPLYDSLDDGQKLRFGLLLHAITGHHHHWRHHAEN